MAALAGSQSSKQIQQMVNFILQEAHEKANEIQVRSDHDYELEVQTGVKNGKQKINEEMEQKGRDREIEDRISRSKSITEARTEKMEAREKLMNQLKTDIVSRIQDYNSNVSYATLLKNLMIQAFQTLYNESNVEVICRQSDEGTVKGELNKAVEEFNNMVGPDKKYKTKISAQFSSRNFLPAEPILGTPSGPGLVVIAQGGAIVCDNTLIKYVLSFLHTLATFV